MAKKKSTEVPIPADGSELAAWIGELAKAQAQKKATDAELEKALAVVRAGYTNQLEEQSSRIKELEKGIGLYLKDPANRKVLLAGTDGKTVKLTTGTISYRWGTWKVQIAKRILELFKGPLGPILALLPRGAVRRKFEPDRRWLLKNWERALQIAGITITRDEFVYVKFEGAPAELPEWEGPKTDSCSPREGEELEVGDEE